MPKKEGVRKTTLKKQIADIKKQGAIERVVAAELTVTDAQKILGEAVAAISARFDSNYPAKPEEIAEAFTVTKAFKSKLEQLEKMGRDRTLELIKANGEEVGDKGTKQLKVGGYFLEARGSGGGYDAKKLEAMIRSKGLTPRAWMAEVITYAVDEAKLPGLLEVKDDDGKQIVTEDELKLCRTERGYAVQTPKEVKEQE